MNPSTIRLIGMIILFIAAVLGVLNLKRVADLGIGWLVSLLVALGVVLVVSSKKRR